MESAIYCPVLMDNGEPEDYLSENFRSCSASPIGCSSLWVRYDPSTNKLAIIIPMTIITRPGSPWHFSNILQNIEITSFGVLLSRYSVSTDWTASWLADDPVGSHQKSMRTRNLHLLLPLLPYFQVLMRTYYSLHITHDFPDPVVN